MVIYPIMADLDWFSSRKIFNFHEDVVLRTPILSTAERILIVGNKNPKDMFNILMGIIKSNFGRIVPDILNDLKRNVDRNIFVIKIVPGLNGLFGLQFYRGIRIEDNNETMQGQKIIAT